jgi:peroxiredoxin Q/BCP
MKLQIGSPAPAVSGKAFWLGRAEGEIFNFDLAPYASKRVILAFYPGDFTSVCTVEMCDFGDNIGSLRELNALVVGISTDSVESHAEFAKKYKLNFPLIADSDKKIGDAYHVSGNFLLPAHKRAIFIIDEHGKLAWKKIELAALFRTEVKEIAGVLAAMN